MVVAEYCGEDIRGDALSAEFVQVVEPEFVLDKKDYVGMYLFNKSAGIAACVGRQVANHIGFVVVFAHLVTRR